MEKGTVVRNDHVWQGHPDVALFQDDLFVCYRESDEHLANVSRIIVRNHSKEIEVMSDESARFNCPRLSVINDHLWMVCDVIPTGEGFIDAENGPDTRIWFWHSPNGTDWYGPFKSNIQGIVPDRPHVLPNGDILIATHTHQKITRSMPAGPNQHIGQGDVYEHAEKYGRLVQNVWRAKSIKETNWLGPFRIAESINHNFCEASITRIDGGIVALMRENSRRGDPAYRCISHDNGRSWSRPARTRLFGCHRPVTGRLKSGNYLTTYRDQTHSVRKPYWAKNTMACLTTAASMVDPRSPLVHSIVLPIDHDRSQLADGGYTGWVQLPDESIFMVNYITDDAPLPYIRWYCFREDEF